MQIQLKKLSHQEKAVNAVNSVFTQAYFIQENRENSHRNPAFVLDNRIKDQIVALKSGQIDPEIRFSNTVYQEMDTNVLGIDVRMETGTGKTYCYTQLMYELHKNYSFNKFILLVPSTAIKEGSKNFIQSYYAKTHFADLYPNTELHLQVLNPQKNKKGRKNFPSSIRDFMNVTFFESNKLNCLLMTDKMLLSKKTMEEKYDQVVAGLDNPYQLLADARPIVIIDEPHRFKRDNKAYQCLLENIKPQAIIRFGATFPKNDQGQIDYNNLVYNLNSVTAFNKNLVKGVAIQTLANVDEETLKIKLMAISAKKPKTATFRNEKTGQQVTLDIGDSLATISSELAGITLDEIGKIEEQNIRAGVVLSNGQTLATGDAIFASIYGHSYQEIMLKQALANHFSQEKANFLRAQKIKTLSLFFIDSVESYRGVENNGYLREKFEQLLKNALNQEIKALKGKTLSPVEQDYLAYLQASLDDIKQTNGGYFAVDNSTSDEVIEKEIDLILRDKESLLSFKNKKGEWNTMRFIFSKWTLREGWDNPNVFQIAKLRSSGSEISKLQEVGRGLRLPVDEYGNRIDNEDFYLTYLIDFSEKDFAKQLVAEVNREAATFSIIDNAMLERVANERGKSSDELFIELLTNKYIRRSGEIIEENRAAFENAYPEFIGGVHRHKIIEKTNEKRGEITIRSANFDKLARLWETLNQKYYLRIENFNEEELLEAVTTILKQSVYGKQFVRVTEQRTYSDDNALSIKEKITDTYHIEETLPYNVFLKELAKQTGFHLKILHQGFVTLNKESPLSTDFFNKKTLQNFLLKYRDWLENTFIKRFSYQKIASKQAGTALTDINGNIKTSILQSNIGLYKDDYQQAPEKFLFDNVIYDSPKEKETIVQSNSIDEVVVFGKIPRRSIRIPLFFGGTTSPDFMYVLKKPDGDVQLNLILETKDVENAREIRHEEKMRIESAEKFFEAMKNEGVNIHFRKQLKNDDIVDLIEEVIK